MELDSTQAQDQVNQQQIAFEKAQYALLSSEKQLDIERSIVDSQVRAAELKLQFAKLDLDKYLEGEARVELLTASNNITKTEAQLSISTSTLMDRGTSPPRASKPSNASIATDSA